MIRLAKALLFAVPMVSALWAQTAPAAQNPADTANAPDNKAGAYYNFAMGRMYAVLAANEGNKNDYVSKAIQHYQEALKLDPSASIVFEELTDLYIQSGRLRDAISQAEDLLKKNPDNLDARRMLGRIYVRATSDNQTGRVNETNLKLAVEQFQKVTEKEPKDAESWVMLGRLYRVSNNSPEAEKAFNAALKADPENEDATFQLAMLYGELGDSKRAIEMLKVVTSKDPNEDNLARLAEQYEQLHDYKSAADVLKKLMELAPDNGRIARGLAADLVESDQFDEALKIYSQLAAEDPKDPSIPLSVAEIYRAKKDFPKAQEALNKAKALDAENLDTKYEEVKLLEAQGKTSDALAMLKGILDQTSKKTYSDNESRRRASLLEEYGVLSRNAEKYAQAVEAFQQMSAMRSDAAQQASLQIIATYRQAKDYTNALKEADALVKKNPDDLGSHLERAMVLADQGKIDAAASEVRGLIKGVPSDLKVQLALAEIYEKAKRYPEMGKALDEAEKLATANDEKENIHFMRGAMYERMKKYDLSEAEFRKVLETNPEQSNALNYLGYMLADRNQRLDEAYNMIKKALDLDPDNGAYLDSLGWVYFRQGKFDEAQGLLQRALDRIGSDPTVHDHLGDVYFKLGKTREAIAQWQASLKESQSGSQSDGDSDEMAKVSKKLDEARVRLAQETRKQK